jgi:hypothetical protein
MPVTHAVDQEAGLVRLALTGVLSAADMVGAVQAVLAALEPGRRYDVLSDHRGLVEPATREQLLQLSDFLVSRGSPFHDRRWAVIVGSQASYGMIRLLSVHLEAVPIWVAPFHDEGEAEAWLARPR